MTGDVRQAATFERGRRDSRPAIAKLHFPTNSISASGRVGSRPRQCFFFFIRRPRGRGHFVSRPAGVPLDPRRRCSGPRCSRGPPRRLPLRASPRAPPRRRKFCRLIASEPSRARDVASRRRSASARRGRARPPQSRRPRRLRRLRRPRRRPTGHPRISKSSPRRTPRRRTCALSLKYRWAPRSRLWPSSSRSPS